LIWIQKHVTPKIAKGELVSRFLSIDFLPLSMDLGMNPESNSPLVSQTTVKSAIEEAQALLAALQLKKSGSPLASSSIPSQTLGYVSVESFILQISLKSCFLQIAQTSTIFSYQFSSDLFPANSLELTVLSTATLVLGLPI